MMQGQNLAHDWFSAALPANIQLGERSWLYSSFAFRHYQSKRPCGLRVGHDSGLYNGTFFDLGPEGEVQIGNFCTLVGAIIATNGSVVIGDYSFIAHEVVIADAFAAIPGRALGDTDGPSVIIGENVWIGAQSILLAGTRIGQGAIVGAAAVVHFDVPEYAIVAGNPAHIKGWVKKPS